MQLAGVLRKAIMAGTYPPGTATPSITTLSQEYGHARQTCSKALGVLVDLEQLRADITGEPRPASKAAEQLQQSQQSQQPRS